MFPDKSRSAPVSTTQPLSLAHFTPCFIADTQKTGPDSKLITISVPPVAVLDGTLEKRSPIWSIYIKDDDIQVERPYTPLEGIDSRGNIKLWIKKYDQGEVGRWLHTKRVGERVDVRGPAETWQWKEDTWDDVVMISGGTGITPFYQLVHHVLSSEQISSKTRFTLLHSSKTPEELPPSEVLSRLINLSDAHPQRFNFRLFVDSIPKITPDRSSGYLFEDTNSDASLGSRSNYDLDVGRINKKAIERALDREGSWISRLLGRPSSQVTEGRKVMVLVCGPEPMINAIAGPYGRNYSQGVVGGVLGELGYKSHQVWKL
ncbi:ferredoxin reductase-like protein [Coniophora puteana RWD-64-598 SS2]|uniref:Ferredoxin reductase-like protein n=1 Tax=Coniophora puteana (strain RWD-64-598) TaxID=741705 RepID=A0A5M3MAN1_CONPW|nr:ferredoxin reductase-like protein [Coniophora puteana RWD-64-598 SS2]EIW76167.1 ferredoxin reductase-like protein [Coniophora puteana RWD-64-598 SS2]